MCFSRGAAVPRMGARENACIQPNLKGPLTDPNPKGGGPRSEVLKKGGRLHPTGGQTFVTFETATNQKLPLYPPGQPIATLYL